MLSGKCWLEVVSYLSTAKTEITNQKKQQKIYNKNALATLVFK